LLLVFWIDQGPHRPDLSGCIFLFAGNNKDLYNSLSVPAYLSISLVPAK